MWQVGPACYDSKQDAASASASQQIGAVVAHGSTSYVVDVASVTDTAINYVLHPIGGGSDVTVTSSYTAQPCGLLDTSDALTMGWAVATAWLVAYGILFFTRFFRHGDA